MMTEPTIEEKAAMFDYLAGSAAFVPSKGLGHAPHWCLPVIIDYKCRDFAESVAAKMAERK